MKKHFLLAIGLLHFAISVAQKDQAKIDSLEEVLRVAIDTQKVNVLIELADVLKYSNDFMAIEHLNEAIKISEWKEYPKGKAKALASYGRILSKQGEHDHGLRKLNEAKEIAEEIGDSNLLAFIREQIGNSFLTQNHYTKALELYVQSINLYRKTDNKEGEAGVLNMQANVYLQTKEYNKAEQLLKEALEINKQIKSERGLSNVLNTWGIVEKRRGNYQKAREHFEESLKYKKAIGSKLGEATITNNIGVIYGVQGDHEKAIEKYKEALEIYRELNLANSICIALDNIGANYRNLGKYDEALKYQQEALQIARESKALGRIENICRDLSSTYKQMGDIENAYYYLWEHLTMKDSIEKVNNREQLAAADKTLEEANKEDKVKELENQLQQKKETIASLSSQRTWLIAGLCFLLLINILVLFLRNKKK